ncbi:hypothetical protein FSARC_5066 [Fusarium sarcochroum]|uniref:Uncharacterized protein n=1 Tax=Fusarium sarcochroum TaxID=1208366 RepID=A0A8H4U0L3_9HYPO|nr:hypothetical protein FSARC_5066 [Fusarium sarcochroum]
MQHWKNNFKESALYFFQCRYETRVKTCSLKPYPVPSGSLATLDHLLPYLLNDLAFFQARIHAEESPESDLESILGFEFGALLWELAGTDPEHFMQLIDDFTTEENCFWEAWEDFTPMPGNRNPFQSNSKPSIQDFSNALNNLFLSKLDRNPKASLSTHFQKYQDTLLRLQLVEFWNFHPSGVNDVYPLHFGLMVYMEREWAKLAWVYLDAALSMMPDLSYAQTEAKSGFENRLWSNLKSKKKSKAVHILYSAAGTGKSHQMFQLLQRSWGFYFLPPRAQRPFISRDTATHYEDCPEMETSWCGGDNNLLPALKFSRVALLHEFLLHRPEATPKEWLWLQISCGKFDPFDALYRVFRLTDTTHFDLSRHSEFDFETPGDILFKCNVLLYERPHEQFTGHMFFCIDDVQIPRHDGDWLFLEHFHSSLLYLRKRYLEIGEAESVDSSNEPNPEGMNPVLLLATPSMRYIAGVIESGPVIEDLGDDHPLLRKWKGPFMHDRFHGVATDEFFWQLYQKHLGSLISERLALSLVPWTEDVQHVPSLTRSCRLPESEISFSSQNTQHLQPGSWLPGTLGVPPFQIVMELLCRVISYTKKEEEEDEEIEQNEPYMIHQLGDLESLLERKDFITAMTILVSNLDQPLELYNPTPLQDKLFLILSNSNTTARKVRSTMEKTMSKIAPTGTNPEALHKAAELLHQQLRIVYARYLIQANVHKYRGRYQWSTAYIEELLASSRDVKSQEPGLPGIRSLVKRANERATHQITDALKSRIQEIKKSGEHGLVQDLLRAGIRGQLMNRPTVFDDEAHAELVESGFALIGRKGEAVQYVISEPMVIQAIMEYLREDGGECQRLMLQSIVQTHDDNEVNRKLGKGIESLVAVSLDRLLRQRLWLDLLVERGSRDILLELLGNAQTPKASSFPYSQDTGAMKLASLIPPEHYLLPDSLPPFEYHQTDTIWNCMKRLKAGERTLEPTFLFPKTSIGPDLMFLLRYFYKTPKDESFTRPITERDDRHLPLSMPVAVKVIPEPSFKVEDVLGNLLVSNWHKELAGRYRAAALPRWNGEPFLHMLVFTGTSVDEQRIDSWIKDNMAKIEKNHFFCVLDQEDTEKLWEQDFKVLSRIIYERNADRLGSSAVKNNSTEDEGGKHSRGPSLDGLLWNELTKRLKK